MGCISHTLVCLVVVVLTAVNSHKGGPPLNCCTDMFPGHHVDAQTSLAIAFIQVKNKAGEETRWYTADEVLTVTVATLDPTVFYEGLFVQARDTKCTSKPIGTFHFRQPNDYLQTLDCAGILQSAIGQKNNTRQTTQTFTWTAPNPTVGHLYLQATVLKNVRTFWVGVTSPFLLDASDTSKPKICDVRSKDGSNAVDTKATVAVVLLGLIMTLANLISFS